MVVMDEVHEQMNDTAVKQIKNIDKLNSEIRILEVMIVKPKSRIPTLKILQIKTIFFDLKSSNSGLMLDNHGFEFANFGIQLVDFLFLFSSNVIHLFVHFIHYNHLQKK